jgi:DNA-binding transcriptional ArsR family regulator
VEAAFRAISDPRRRQVLRLVRDRERSAGEIHRALGEVTFGAVSQSLRILRGAGLVQMRRDGRRRLYRARPEGLAPLMQWLDEMWGNSLDRLRVLAEADVRDDSPATTPPSDPSAFEMQPDESISPTEEPDP